MISQKTSQRIFNINNVAKNINFLIGSCHCQRRILGIRWFHFVTNASVTSKTGEEGLAIRICRRRLSIFGHVRRLPEATPAHSALRLAVDARTGVKPDIRPEWKRQRGRPCRMWVQQIEDDTGLNANDA